MRTISENVSVNFVSATFNDALKMLPLMDGMVADLLRIKEKVEKGLSYDNWFDSKLHEFTAIKERLLILLQCGFIASDEDLLDQLIATDLKAIHSQWKYDKSGKIIIEGE